MIATGHVAAAAALAAFATCATADYRAVLQGPAAVTADGQLDIAGTQVQLWGIDVPTNAWCENAAAPSKETVTMLVSHRPNKAK